MDKKLIIFTDIGDTIIDEGTEFRLENDDVVQHADCIPGAKETTLKLYEAGYTYVMVADGLVKSFHNMMDQHGLSHVFSKWIISEEVGADKPDPAMFEAAFNALGLKDADKSRVIMVGNNLLRDIIGANRFGITSVYIDTMPRRKFPIVCDEMKPDYTIHTPNELWDLCEKLNAEL